jgi:2-methylisocitrate lyase-like PEP mutase family enzyme
MVLSENPDIETLASLGVARISLGPAPYRRHIAEIEAAARETAGKRPSAA